MYRQAELYQIGGLLTGMFSTMHILNIYTSFHPRANCISLVNRTLPYIISGRSLCHLTLLHKVEIYAGITILNVILNICRVAFLFVILIRASCALHNAILASILGFPIRFFDLNPIGKQLKSFAYICDHI